LGLSVLQVTSHPGDIVDSFRISRLEIPRGSSLGHPDSFPACPIDPGS